MKKSQKERVIGQLNKKGFITRNECLRVFITRLSAIIFDLKEEGWDFKVEEKKGDYYYHVIKKPELKLF